MNPGDAGPPPGKQVKGKKKGKKAAAAANADG